MELATQRHVKDSHTQDEGENSEIATFFDQKSVFITGAAGFVGTVVLATLMRCCPGIKHFYILLREKKGVPPEVRKEQVFKKKIFQVLKREYSVPVEKVKVVEGDITSPNLGISNDDLEEMKENVSIVFHCAAVVSFNKPLRYMLDQNLLGTQHVIDICLNLPKLEACVHTSTAYSNCNKREGYIEESIYRSNVPAKKFLEALRLNASDDTLASMESQCLPAWPNTYTFTKALAEDLIADYADDLPVAIVRPSIIVSSWKGVMPGYIEEGAGIIDVSVGIGKGFIRVLYCDESKKIDFVPVDIVVNTLITSSWGIGTQKFSSPLVVNCTTSTTNPCTWGHFVTTLYEMQELYPLPKMYQLPFLVMRKHRTTYWASALVNHYAPAVCIDLALMAMKKKPRLTKLYRFYDLVLNYLEFFLTNDWNFRFENLPKLREQLNAKDTQMLPMELKGFNIEVLSKVIREGAPFYQWENDTKKKQERLPIAYKRALVTNFIKWMVIIWFAVFFIFVLTKSFSRTPIF